jgi:hypothetical protein
MLVRIPTPTISRTYVRSKTSDEGVTSYEASITLPKIGQRVTSTKTSFRAAIKTVRRKAGIRE